jgi:hypothetical protein
LCENSEYIIRDWNQDQHVINPGGARESVAFR